MIASISPRFLAHFVHEVRTPLNAILGFSHLLERQPGRVEYARVINLAGHRLERSLAGFMDWLQLVANPSSLTPMPLTTGQLVSSVQTAMADFLRQRGVELDTRNVEDVPFEADRHYLSSAISVGIGGILASLSSGDVLEIGSNLGEEMVFWLGWRAAPDVLAAVRDMLDAAGPPEGAMQAREAAPNIELRVARLLIEAQGGSIELASKGEASRLQFRLPQR